MTNLVHLSRILGFLQRTIIALLIAIYLPLVAVTQVTERQKPVDLVINVFVSSMPNRASSGITVQVMSGLGNVEQEVRTDTNGRVECHTLTGIHRLRIFGLGIQEYEENFEIELSETRSTRNVIVRAKPSSGNSSGLVIPKSDSIPAARLRAPDKAQSEFQRGSKAMELKDWVEAKKRFQAAIDIYPDYDVAYNGLGSALMASGDVPAARIAFEKAVTLNDGFGEAYRNLARISLTDHKYDEADSFLVKSLAVDPLNAWALTSCANVELLMHKYDEAIVHARKAHSVPHPGLAGVHIVAALALEATQQPFEAIKEYQLYLDEDPKGRDAAGAHKAIERLSGPAAK